MTGFDEMLEAMSGAALAPLYDTPVAFHGERKDARPVDLTATCMVTEDVATIPGDAIAPTLERVFNIALPKMSWRDATPPQIGEWLRFRWRGIELWAKVRDVSHMPDGDYALVASWEPKRNGGPAW